MKSGNLIKAEIAFICNLVTSQEHRSPMLESRSCKCLLSLAARRDRYTIMSRCTYNGSMKANKSRKNQMIESLTSIQVCRVSHESKLRLSRQASVIIPTTCSKLACIVLSRVTNAGYFVKASPQSIRPNKCDTLQPRLCFMISNNTGAQAMTTPLVREAASAKHPSASLAGGSSTVPSDALCFARIADHCIMTTSYAKGNHRCVWLLVS
mmetsp:Transcript_16621/g.25832  ORF Transcript_16621/g.25832 Transcript_16621/m.25832 type:complete len:209 (+) Transcript_16621:4627-5253(+)